MLKLYLYMYVLLLQLTFRFDLTIHLLNSIRIGIKTSVFTGLPLTNPGDHLGIFFKTLRAAVSQKALKLLLILLLTIFPFLVITAETVMVNLINNAVKYAPDSYYIFIAVENHGDTARISVKDTGPGIPFDKIPHLFERYYRADASGKQVSGLGLGLYISAEIIERHGGQIGAESEIGIGSSFWFTLPLGNC
jgi:signal transduction histidine kinase